MIRARQLAAAGITLLAFTSQAWAGGFELPDNTAESLARGATGAAGKRDPSAIYYNPALLPRTNGFELQLDSNLVFFDVEFQRNDLEYGSQSRTYGPSTNEAPPFPVPFLAASYDFGIDDLGVGIGVFGPHAYGRRCFGELVDGDCVPVDRTEGYTDGDPLPGGRYMMVESNLLQVYMTLAAGYRFRDVLFGGDLSVGLTAGAAWQQTSFTLNVDEIIFTLPYDEDPNNAALFEAKELTGWRPMGILGLAWERSGFTLAASYRPPIKWKTTGTAELTYPQLVVDLADPQTVDPDDPSQPGNRLQFETWQAGSLRLGLNYADGEHPGRPGEPRFDLELNVVWEDWSRTEDFVIDTQFDIVLFGTEQQALAPIAQPKNWQDVFSVRVGSTYAAFPWLSFHVGGFLETAAQRVAQTNVDFVSWERYALGFGNTFHLADWLDLDVGYSYVLSPDRTVTKGEVYQQLPLSECTGPEYTSDACSAPGQPPGNAQNEGVWSSSFQMLGVGLTVTVD